MGEMFLVIFEKHQVLYSVVVLDFIDVVNHLFRIKHSTEVFFHHQTMFADVSERIAVRVFGPMKKDVTISPYPSALPQMMLFSLDVGSFLSLYPRRIAFFERPA